MNNLLFEKNVFTGDLAEYDKVLEFISFFANINEEDYISYNEDKTFEYTPRFYEFIESLFRAGLVEDYNKMREFLSNACFDFEESDEYVSWIHEMNKIICRPELLSKANLSFIRKAFLTLIRLEYRIPGSWGIDIEVCTWLKLLKRLNQIRPELA
ncbi:MAG TPA: hypothetical protein PLP11_05060 [Bacteroidales bacterium]|nr:hypothetical protein [Bacteroidales bacterium]HQP03955.1 hypothetical protein [Bacteroidales bacterium]